EQQLPASQRRPTCSSTGRPAASMRPIPVGHL
uniref:Uncharacterized protein n=1 Tax=Solanum lycopersicum TaxID=4081 RepID=A0A3Q7EAF5_SOLLC